MHSCLLFCLSKPISFFTVLVGVAFIVAWAPSSWKGPWKILWSDHSNETSSATGLPNAGLDVATCGVANATSFCSVATKFSRLVAYLAPKIGDSLFGKTYTNDNPLSFRKLNPLILKYNSWRPEYLFWRQKMKTWGPAGPTTFFWKSSTEMVRFVFTV